MSVLIGENQPIGVDQFKRVSVLIGMSHLIGIAPLKRLIGKQPPIATAQSIRVVVLAGNHQSEQPRSSAGAGCLAVAFQIGVRRRRTSFTRTFTRAFMTTKITLLLTG